MQSVFSLFKERFSQDPYPTLKVRMSRLKTLKRLLEEYTPELCKAISSDFGFRSTEETKLVEIFPILTQIKFTEKHLPQWFQHESRTIEWFFQFASAKVIHVPLGVIGIITPWNFPLLLSFSPLISALAGGNLALIKLSEFTPQTALVLKDAFQKYLPECVQVITGDIEASKNFSSLPFDHLFFTGSPNVGSLVMQAAAKNLTPVTLELGGKCPVLVAPDAPIDDLLHKLNWAKILNSGQVCLAPDYLLCPENIVEALIEKWTTIFKSHYPNGVSSGSFTSMITETHFNRLQQYLDEAQQKGAKIIPLHKEAVNGAKRLMVPHLVLNPPSDCRLMHEEIFGPILPIYTYSDFRDYKFYLNRNPNPLALYLFTHDQKLIEEFETSTSSGGLVINDFVIHIAQDHLPFGGVRQSGLGAAHGIEGYLTFTRPKSIFRRKRLSLIKLIYPPYKKKILNLFFWFFGIRRD